MQNFKDEEAKENEKSKGICGPDMWYSPRGKSCPCVVLMIFLYIILLPFIIILAFSIALWYCLSTCYTKMFMTGMNTARVDWTHFHKWWNKTIHINITQDVKCKEFVSNNLHGIFTICACFVYAQKQHGLVCTSGTAFKTGISWET